jgi:hypothetical protein
MRNYEGKVYIWEGINQADAANDFACMPTEIAFTFVIGLYLAIMVSHSSSAT